MDKGSCFKIVGWVVASVILFPLVIIACPGLIILHLYTGDIRSIKYELMEGDLVE